ncbi:MAG TPA: hypothetical protein VN213_06660 [Solirubrobacteraceae bacterium]|nr:hypothetical protein [Solirubrobacteraceae bacterium]
MARPGLEVTVSDAPPSRSLPTDTSRLFIVDFAQKGDHTTPIRLTGPADAAAKIGDRVSYSYARDAMDVYGAEAYFARVVGPAPVAATAALAGTSGTTLNVTAKSVGDWGNGATGGLSVEVANGPSGATHRVLIIRLNGVEVERTPEYNSRDSFVTWSQASSYVTITAGAGTGLPTVAAAANLAGGTDDRSNATDTHWKAAVDRFQKELGPGQVAMLGRTTSQAHTDLLAHAQANNRVAILDGPNTLAKATLTSAVNAVRTLAAARYGGLFAPWVSYPGLAPGTTRTLPPSMFVAAKIAEVDPVEGPNQPAAGRWGRLEGALGVAATGSLTDLDYQDLNELGVNMIRVRLGVPTIFGWRTLADKDDFPLRWKLSNQRLEMLIIAESQDAGEDFIFRQIDGQGITLAGFGSAIGNRLNQMYVDGWLFPDPDDPRPETAFYVDTSSAVNTEQTIADGQLIADVAYRPSSFAELVKVRIVVVPIGTPITV